jgi:hypothetical protein
MNTQTLYDTDFNSWIEQHIILLKQGRFNEIDTTHLIEELKSLAKDNKRELENYLLILITYLLKWQYQSVYRCNEWLCKINENRLFINHLLEDSPSLMNYLPLAIETIYIDCIALATRQTKLNQFPNECSYTIKELLDEDFYPNNTVE